MTSWPLPFAYSSEPHERRHGPKGYAHPHQFKPWLRDEFEFRCVYCLIRERWLPDGDSHFSVEHLRPMSKSPELAADYDNLFYACCRCNAGKQDLDGILNPCVEPFADHLLVTSDGGIQGLTEAGRELIQVCQLDRPLLVEFRRDLFLLLQLIQSSDDPEWQLTLRRFFGFPANLPRLRNLRPHIRTLLIERLLQLGPRLLVVSRIILEPGFEQRNRLGRLGRAGLQPIDFLQRVGDSALLRHLASSANALRRLRCHRDFSHDGNTPQENSLPCESLPGESLPAHEAYTELSGLQHFLQRDRHIAAASVNDDETVKLWKHSY